MADPNADGNDAASPECPPLDPRPGNRLGRIWRGVLSLPAICWLGLCVGSFLFGRAAVPSVRAASTLAEAAIPLALQMIGPVVMTVWLFRGAAGYEKKNPRSAPTAWAARIAAALWLVGQISLSLQDIRHVLSHRNFDASVTQANRALPRMEGEDVRLDGVARDGRTIVYTMTLLRADGALFPQAVTEMRERAIATECGQDNSLRLLLRMEKITYRIMDAGGRLAATYDVAAKDCS